MSKQNTAFINRFRRHLANFIEYYQLFNKSEDLYLAVSGGVDSMVMLESIIALRSCGYSNRFIILHVNHGTRPGQEQDQQLVEAFCRKHHLEFKSKQLHDIGEGNFEKNARDARYEFFHSQANGRKLLLAQHINDSFEWTLMQQFKSSHLSATLGIPVINGNIRRPLMAFSKGQIRNYAQQLSIPFREDPTNIEDDFERNRIRKKIQGLCSHYPSALKNYVERHNELARRLNLHAVVPTGKYKVFYGKGAAHIFNLNHQHDPIVLKALLRKVIHNLSNQNRGSIRAQLDRVIQMVQNNKFGPLKLAGGLEIINYFGHILIKGDRFTLQTGQEFVQHIRLPIDFSLMSYTEFKKILYEMLTNRSLIPSYPLWVIVRRKSWVRCPNSLLTEHASLLEFCKAHGLGLISAAHLYRQWSKGVNKEKQLSLHIV